MNHATPTPGRAPNDDVAAMVAELRGYAEAGDAEAQADVDLILKLASGSRRRRLSQPTEADIEEAQQLAIAATEALEPQVATEILGLIADLGLLHQTMAVISVRSSAMLHRLDRDYPRVPDHLANEYLATWSEESGSNLLINLLCSIGAMAEEAADGSRGDRMEDDETAKLLAYFRGSGPLVTAARRGVGR